MITNMIPGPTMFLLYKKLPLYILIIFTLAFSACGPGSGKTSRTNTTKAKPVEAVHYHNLLNIYNSFSYNWEGLDQGVPPLLLDHFPSDIHMIKPTAKKKKFFFQSILPMALIGNEEIKRQRNAIENILSNFDNEGKLSLHQHEELIDIQNYYNIKGDILQDEATRLKFRIRVDTIPPSLILAQAANESGWGMSRFAQQANNIFGEWTFTPGTGIVPKGRPAGATYEVRRFKNLYASIRSYLRNLNTHRAYRSMRMTRLRLREKGLPATGYTLAGDMQYYSTRREAYVSEIRAIIVGNRLDELNLVALKPEAIRQAPGMDPEKGGLMSTLKKILRQSKS